MAKRNHDDARKHWTTCDECGKRTYLTRAAAKEAARLIPRPEKMVPYPGCVEGTFHVGHMARTRTREDYRDRNFD